MIRTIEFMRECERINKGWWGRRSAQSYLLLSSRRSLCFSKDRLAGGWAGEISSEDAEKLCCLVQTWRARARRPVSPPFFSTGSTDLSRSSRVHVQREAGWDGILALLCCSVTTLEFGISSPQILASTSTKHCDTHKTIIFGSKTASLSINEPHHVISERG